MAYMNQEKKAKIQELIKPLLKHYGLKGSLSVRHNSTIVLTIPEGAINFLEGQQRDYLQVNVYHIDKHFTGVAREFLEKAMEALYSADWYDRSDAQIDHFDTAYYIDINIGRWNKPYVFKP